MKGGRMHPTEPVRPEAMPESLEDKLKRDLEAWRLAKAIIAAAAKP
jgi:hypothetical protein